MRSQSLFAPVCLLLALVWTPVFASQPSTTPPPAMPGRAVLPDRFDLKATPTRPLDLSRPVDGRLIILEVVEDVSLRTALDQEVHIPKKALLYGQLYVQADSFSLLVNRALWNGGGTPLNAYLAAPVQVPGLRRSSAAGLLPVAADVRFGTRARIAGRQQEIPVGTVLELRHLDRDYKPQAVLRPIDAIWDDVAVARRLAPTGDARSEYVLASAYLQEQLLRKDPYKAAFWFLRSAEQGFAPAQNDIAVLYAQGNGVARDDVAAYMWFKLALDAGHERDRSALEILERRMPAAQVAEAKQRADNWTQAHPRRPH